MAAASRSRTTALERPRAARPRSRAARSRPFAQPEGARRPISMQSRLRSQILSVPRLVAVFFKTEPRHPQSNQGVSDPYQRAFIGKCSVEGPHRGGSSGRLRLWHSMPSGQMTRVRGRRGAAGQGSDAHSLERRLRATAWLLPRRRARGAVTQTHLRAVAHLSRAGAPPAGRETPCEPRDDEPYAEAPVSCARVTREP